MTALITPEENAFIRDINDRNHIFNKDILKRFNALANTSARSRLSHAIRILQKQERTGWLQIGIPKATRQTTYSHQKGVAYLLDTLKVTHAMAEATSAIPIVKHHNTTEAITGNFTAADPITQPEKSCLEAIAARILFEGHPKENKLWHEFEAAKTPRAQLAHDADKIEILCHGLRIEEHHPESHNILNPLWSYTKQGLKTDAMLPVFQELENARNGAPSATYQSMQTFYRAQKPL